MNRRPVRLPSLQRELIRSLTLVSIGWLAAVVVAVTFAVRHEVDDLMDSALQEAAEVLYAILLGAPDLPRSPGATLPAPPHGERLIWQIVNDNQQVMLRSNGAPTEAVLPAFRPGFSDAPTQWRVFAMRLPSGGESLYVGQRSDNRNQSRYESVVFVAASALLVGVLCALWMRRRVAQTISPLQEMSLQVKRYDPMRPETGLPEPTREELVDMRDAITDLGQRLARRIDSERAFSAHAAHALRTPLAGMEAQLAVALQEASAAARPRLERTRQAVQRLNRVITSLLALFRSGEELDKKDIDLDALMALLPVASLNVQVQPGSRIHGDINLLAAALANLLDNSVRYGASRCVVSVRNDHARQILTVADDGPGVTPQRRAELQAGLDRVEENDSFGIGLKLAALVARAHDGRLIIDEPKAGTTGFSVSMVLWDEPDAMQAG